MTELSGRIASATADDQCWFGRTLIHAALELPEPNRGILLRVFIGAS